MRNIITWVLVLFLWVLLGITACSDEDENNTQNKTGQIQQLGPLLAEQCAVISACSGGSVNNCMSIMANDDVYELGALPYVSIALEKQGKCLDSASTCEDVDQCRKQFAENAWAPDVAITPQCTNVEEVYCEDDILVWCFMGEYFDEALPVTYDLSLSGKTCNAAGTGPTDSEHTSCELENEDSEGFYSPKTCSGDYITQCLDGELISYDCKLIDSEFSCYYRDEDSVECGIPPGGDACETNNYNNQGDDGWCDGVVAVSCVNGKTYRTDCTTLKNGSCVESDYNASCVSDLYTPIENLK